ncbi:O-antigen ligase family protein [Dyella sp.]|uniref:O-antigen ligase family protein n=1 Tax=Dyella sp. TaxID=1869338 RepID=UPI002D79FF15|nr:O-antigen ligase family protein [Dyella sp.]HET6430608.1 O-antigen ligase family protein [Dyella sp.]
MPPLTSERLTWMLSWCAASLPLGFALSSRAKLLPMAVLMVAGVALLVRRADVRRAWWQTRWVVAACVLRLLYDVANVLGHRLGWAPLDLPSQTLPFLAVAAVFALPLDRRILGLGVSVATAVLGAACLWQRYVRGIDRPYGLNGGDWAAIEFAMYLLIMVLLSLLQALRSDLSRRARAAHAAAAVLGLYGAVLTQSRGPLLAFAPVCALVLLWHGWQSRRWRCAGIALALVTTAMLAVTASMQREMLARFRAVPHELATFVPGRAHGAIGQRLEMWRLSWRVFTAHPSTGLGLDQFGPYVRAAHARGEASAAIAGYVHPHSEYFESLVAGGWPALLVLALFLGVPLTFFAKHMADPDEGIRRTAAGAAAAVAMFDLCAFSDNVFYRAMPHSLYLFLVLGLAVDIGRRTGVRTVPIR